MIYDIQNKFTRYWYIIYHVSVLIKAVNWRRITLMSCSESTVECTVECTVCCTLYSNCLASLAAGYSCSVCHLPGRNKTNKFEIQTFSYFKNMLCETSQWRGSLCLADSLQIAQDSPRIVRELLRTSPSISYQKFVIDLTEDPVLNWLKWSPHSTAGR